MTQFTVHRVRTSRRARPTFQDTGLKFGLVLVAALVFTSPEAFSASNVSSEYDGRYAGAMTPASDASPKLCPAATITEFVIKGGYVKAPAKVSDTNLVIFDGFVTADGFVTGHFRLPGGPLNEFEGRMVQETGTTLLSGGLTESEKDCAYLLELRKTIQP